MVSLRWPPTCDALPNALAAAPVFPARESDPTMSTLYGAPSATAAHAEHLTDLIWPRRYHR